jgi:hypothetical protein
MTKMACDGAACLEIRLQKTTIGKLNLNKLRSVPSEGVLDPSLTRVGDNEVDDFMRGEGRCFVLA